MERGVDERGISADDQRQRDVVEHVATGGVRVDTAIMLRARGVGETEAAAGMPIEEVLTNEAVFATRPDALDLLKGLKGE